MQKIKAVVIKNCDLDFQNNQHLLTFIGNFELLKFQRTEHNP